MKVHELIICIVGGELLLAVPFAMWFLGRIANAAEAIRREQDRQSRAAR